MSAKGMYDSLNSSKPDVREKHHGNKRKALASMKVKARKAERAKLNRSARTP